MARTRNKIRLFVASSAELRSQRLEITELTLLINPYLRRLGVEFEIVKWEYLDSSTSASHKQEEYNEQICQCDILLALFATHLGRYTKEELDHALLLLQTKQRMWRIYLWFQKNDNIEAELQAFKAGALHHYSSCMKAEFSDLLECRMMFLQLIIDELHELKIAKLHINNNYLMYNETKLTHLSELGF